jgi:hypothetical protein
LEVLLPPVPRQVRSLAPVFGQASLDLNLLGQTYSLDEADNLRWSLIRRTAMSEQVYSPVTGVDWVALRQMSQQNTILVPDGFTWSFNETFQGGSGYKEAGGILAGGHCALATVFRTAADRAGLPTEFRMHARPIPGFVREETVNIYWGRDDLLVRNTSGQDLYFVWRLTPDQVEISLTPVEAFEPLPLLPEFQEATIAMVYGHPGPGGWGSLGQTWTVDQALQAARMFATRVDGWNVDRPAIIAVNPNVTMGGRIAEDDEYVHQLIAEARRQGLYVMLDVHTGDQDPLALFSTLMDKYLQENVWLDWDLEHTAGGEVSAEQINTVAQAYFQRRQERSYRKAGIFAFYVFATDQVSDAEMVRRSYEQGLVVPIFDGFGAGKVPKTNLVIDRFAPGPFGIMEFETRWGDRYDSISAQEYFETFQNALIMASQ